MHLYESLEILLKEKNKLKNATVLFVCEIEKHSISVNTRQLSADCRIDQVLKLFHTIQKTILYNAYISNRMCFLWRYRAPQF